MKKLNLLIILAFVLVISACGSGEAEGDADAQNNEEETIVLTAGSNLPSEHISMVGTMIPFMERVEEESDGRVQFEVHDSESLVRAGEELEALRSGTIDIAIPMYEAYDLSRFPLSEVPMLPVTHTDRTINGDALSTMWQSEEPYQDGETFNEKMYGSQDLTVWPANVSKSYTIATVGDPVESLEQLQNLQLRSPSNIHDLFAGNLGASPINMSINETYDALSRGTIDGGFSIIEDWDSYGFQEVYDYAIEDLHLGFFAASIAMTDEKFNSLPEDIQVIINEAASEMPIPSHNDFINEHLGEAESNILDGFAESGGNLVSVDEMPEDMQNTIENSVTETWDDWIQGQEENGEPGLETAIKWRDAILEAGGDVPEEIKELTIE